MRLPYVFGAARQEGEQAMSGSGLRTTSFVLLVALTFYVGLMGVL
jgi:hypothetical protein